MAVAALASRGARSLAQARNAENSQPTPPWRTDHYRFPKRGTSGTVCLCRFPSAGSTHPFHAPCHFHSPIPECPAPLIRR
eukprot:4769606-Alexandrium_andersonii.AAC.1